MTTITAERYTVTLKQAAALVVAVPQNRFALLGEPGIGKTSLKKELQRLTGYRAFYADCANMDLGDAAVPMPVQETKTLEYFINSAFGMHLDEPVIIILDEFTKAADPIKNMLHPLLEVNDPRMGSVLLPKGSIVVITGNLESDGVGDSLLAHTRMRLTMLEISKPTAKEWLAWASTADIAPVVTAWVHRNPQALTSYRDGDQKGNPYIYFPNHMTDAVVTPRTLELASNIVKARFDFDYNSLQAALAGTVGKAAAGSIAAFIAHQDSLPPWESIIREPTKAPLPDSDGAMSVLVFGGIEQIKNKDEVTAFMEYLSRGDLEWQGVFCVHIARHPTKQALAFGCKAFADWLAKNQDIL
jgi:hypothetical protein